VSPSAEEQPPFAFEEAPEVLEYLRGREGSDYLQFVGEGEFGSAWIAWEDETLYFTSESGLRIADHSAFLFARKCLGDDAYTIHPVDRSAVAYLDDVVS
jgi:hypothetical protein